MPVRPRFDPSNEFVAARGFTYQGVDYEVGQPFPKAGLSIRQLQQQYDSRAIAVSPIADQVVVTHTGGTWYEVAAPWLDAPVKANGKGKAEREAKRVRAEGPPEGWEPPAS